MWEMNGPLMTLHRVFIVASYSYIDIVNPRNRQTSFISTEMVVLGFKAMRRTRGEKSSKCDEIKYAGRYN